MARIPIDNLGAAGVIRDIFAHDTPPEAWTHVINGRMGPYGAEKFLGHSKAIGTGSAGWAIAPYWLAYAPVPGDSGFWVAMGAAKIYARTANSPYTESNITRQVGAVDNDYAATDARKWNASIFGGLLVLNNGIDVPQYWDPLTGAAVRMQDFSAVWPSTYRARVLRPFGRFLVAINLTVGGTAEFPQLVKWSHPADPGALPSSWDHTDPSVDAGEYPLQDAQGALMEQQVLRGINMLYTTDQVWQMRFVGGGDVMGFDSLLLSQGILGTNCLAKFKKDTEYHFVVGNDDIYLNNGQSAKSVITPTLRRWFFQQIDPNYYDRSFVVANPRFSEIWACIPELGSEQPSLALVWNWETGAVGFRDLLKASSGSDTRTTGATMGTPCIAPGFIDDVDAETWDADSGSWDSDTTQWDERNSSPALPRLLMLDRSSGKRTFLLDDTTTFDGSAFSLTLERTGLSIIGRDRQGQPKNDTETTKLLTEIWPRVETPAGTQLLVSVGTQNAQEEGVAWSAPYTYTVGADAPFLSVYHSGLYLSIRFVHEEAVSFRMPGYALDIEGIGKYY